MPAKKKRIPPQDVIREDSGPTITQVEEPEQPVEVDADDAMLEEPKDHVFKKRR